MLKETFGQDKCWVNWKYEVVNDKKTKVPYSVTGGKAQSSNPETWSTYDEVKAKSDSIGIMFPHNEQLLGIDIDHCMTSGEITHPDRQTIAEFIVEANTYCEYSPSGEGLHLFLRIEEPLTLVKNKKAPYELYTKGRYFTVTERPYKEPQEVRTVSKAEAIKLLNIIGYPWLVPSEKVEVRTTPDFHLDDQALLIKMFTCVGGDKTKRLWEGDISDYKHDASSADMALCIRLAFWTGGNKERIRFFWLSSPLGQREKVQKRVDYVQRTINSAATRCTEYYNPRATRETEFDEIEFLMTVTNKIEKPTLCIENICRILRNNSKYKFRFDEFTIVDQIQIGGGKWTELDVPHALQIQTEISVKYDFFQRVSKDMIYDACMQVCRENTYDSPKQYLMNLNWDGQARLDTWLCDAYGVEDNRYYRAVGSNWMKGLVKRLMVPGCKFDYVMVLEGKQGIKKSTSLAELGGKWHVETTMSTDNKDFFMLFAGKAIVEFSEGETLSKTEVKRMKAIITMQFDKFRMPYARVSKEFPRRCVFAMTTNESKYLKDDTGNRRWLPVECKKADVKWIQENRDQMFAEAYHRVITLNEPTWEFPEIETRNMQNERRILDPNADAIVNWYYNSISQAERDEGVTIKDIFDSAIHHNKGDRVMTGYDVTMIGGVLKDILFLENKRTIVNRVRATRWFPTSETDIVEDTVGNFQKDFADYATQLNNVKE